MARKAPGGRVECGQPSCRKVLPGVLRMRTLGQTWLFMGVGWTWDSRDVWQLTERARSNRDFMVGRRDDARRHHATDTGRLVQPADEATVGKLIAITTLAVRCRSAVERDGRTREIELVPEAEAPARLALVLLRLWNGLRAIGCDAGTAWALTTKAAMDSMPALRRRALEYLVSRDAAASTPEIAVQVEHPTTTTRRALEDLAAHGILVRAPQGAGKSDQWEPTA